MKNNSLSNFLCKLVIYKQLILKTKQQNCYGRKNKENLSHMLNLNEYGAWQAKMNGENQCFKGVGNFSY